MKKMTMGIIMIFAANICFAGSLGDGYKGAKWGMSPEEVKSAIKDSGEYPYSVFDQSEPEYGYRLIFYEEKPGDRKEKINCYFDDGVLYGVKYMPGGSTSTENILMAMKEKYGKPNKSYNGRSGAGFPVKVYEWNDSKTKISLQITKYDYFTSADVYYFSINLKRVFGKKRNATDDEDTKKNINREKKNL